MKPLKMLWTALKYLLHGGPLSGKKTLVGVVMFFMVKWFPEIPLGELQAFVLVAAEFMIKWGLASKALKLLNAK